MASLCPSLSAAISIQKASLLKTRCASPKRCRTQLLQDRGGSSVRENPDRASIGSLRERSACGRQALGGTPSTTPVRLRDLRCHYSHDPGERTPDLPWPEGAPSHEEAEYTPLLAIATSVSW